MPYISLEGRKKAEMEEDKSIKCERRLKSDKWEMGPSRQRKGKRVKKNTEDVDEVGHKKKL